MSRSRQPRTLIAVLAGAALALAACSGGGGSNPEPDGGPTTPSPTPSTAPIELTYATPSEFSSYNNNTADQANPANAAVLNQVLRGFWSYGPEGDVVPDTEFGTFELTGTDPQTVKYTFADAAVWSDGEPIDCDDAVLAWAANVGRWPTGEVDQYTKARLTAFSSLTPGAWARASMPKCADGDRTFTMTFEHPYADWKTFFGPSTILPAHIVEKRSGVKDVISAVKGGKNATMRKLGRFYNTGWLFEPGKYETAISPSSGPYQVASWKPGKALTLEPNPKWWGAVPAARTIVFRLVHAQDQAQALVDGTVQVIHPTPTEKILKTLSAAKGAVKVSSHDSAAWEHADYNFDGPFSSRALREAFTKCLPRQQIVDELIKPLNPRAQVLHSRFRLPFQKDYPEFAQTGGQDYAKADVAGARKILEKEKKVGTRVEIAYLAPDLRRENEVKLIKKSCGKAGFKVVDAGSYTFLSSELVRGNFDVALYSATDSASVTQSSAVYTSKGAENRLGYSSKKVDGLYADLAGELDEGRQRDLLKQLDTALWHDLVDVPIFAFPALLATDTKVQGVQDNPSWSGVTYNVNTWTSS
ncbi:ABC transporter substrate-binding protein [Kineosporia mesophila]|uniref:ABC transporter substrate-binding protein n=1 Tax=Kineosporia mesophila TaxID=566012 RepID=A0ABP6YU27_9ACTN|nr:ABC transporter family substrate-binding protein [Kineosporia mesophila]MCD5352274.1 ABC transporter family substrate-binding protein [Kineosporia mesophila]